MSKGKQATLNPGDRVRFASRGGGQVVLITGTIVVGASPEASTVLMLFRAAGDGDETELLLDQAGNIRARWTSNMPGGLAPPATLIADAERVDRIAVAAPSHAGHGH
jgi:hypothetical protein